MAAAYTKDHPGRTRGGLHDWSVESPASNQATQDLSPAMFPIYLPSRPRQSWQNAQLDHEGSGDMAPGRMKSPPRHARPSQGLVSDLELLVVVAPVSLHPRTAIDRQLRCRCMGRTWLRC